MSRLPRLLHPSRRRAVAALLVTGLAQALIGGGIALLVQMAFDGLSRDLLILGREHLVLFGGFVAGAIAILALRSLERGIAEWFGQHYVAALRLRLFRHTVRQSFPRLQARRRGHLMLRFVGDLTAVKNWIALGFSRLLVAAVVAPVTLIILALMNATLALAVLALILLSAFAMFALGGPLKARYLDERRRRSQLAGNIGEKITEASVVRIAGRETSETRRIAKQSSRLVATAVRRARLSMAVRTLPDVTNMIAVAALIFLGYGGVAAGHATPGTIVGAMTVLGLLIAPLRDLARVFDQRRAFLVAKTKIEAYLATPELPKAERIIRKLKDGEGRIRFRRAGVRGAIGPLDLRLAEGELVAVTGPNGAGKSSLLLMAAGLLPPDKGHVFIDGMNVYALSTVRRAELIGMVSRDLPLLRGRLSRTLTYRRPGASAEEIDEALVRAGLADIVHAFPGGLDMRLSEGGRNLSSGVRLRLALARAIIGRPRLLLLDEADSGLDQEARGVLDALLAKREQTTLIVTHDPARLRSVDRVLYLEAGVVKEDASPGDLLMAGGAASRLFAA